MSLLIRTLILSDYGLTFMAPFNFNYFCRDPIQLQPHWGRASVCEFGGHKHLVCNAWLPCICPREMTCPYTFFCFILFLIKLGLGTSTAKSGILWWQTCYAYHFFAFWKLFCIACVILTYCMAEKASTLKCFCFRFDCRTCSSVSLSLFPFKLAVMIAARDCYWS